MDLIQSIILGAIQGITEFFPISSTAHLVLLPWFLSWKDQGLPLYACPSARRSPKTACTRSASPSRMPSKGPIR